ncbi:hypothetical protein CKO20_01620 [Rhodocyclus tenuis]|nr:hypothetical protein [Rhodocyclus tenuis]
MQEWGVWWQAIGVTATVFFGVFGLYKIYHELKRLNEQREKDILDKDISAKLNRTKFFLEQHRRLFDNSELYEVTCLLDADDKELADKTMWDKKRKFLTFIEEIALLVKSDQINEEVAFYMFGYYARCAMHGCNFRVGIDPAAEHWGLFYEFTENYEKHLINHPEGPPCNLSL